MTLNYATIASTLFAQTEATKSPRFQPTTQFRLNYSQAYQPKKTNYNCYTCGEYGHAARDCMSEKRTTYEQRNQMNKPQFVKRRNINMVAVEDDDDYWEDEVYVTHPPRASPYSTNRKEQKEKQRLSESRKELNLRNRTVTPHKVPILNLNLSKLIPQSKLQSLQSELL